jgi:hypothetical protein
MLSNRYSLISIFPKINSYLKLISADSGTVVSVDALVGADLDVFEWTFTDSKGKL